MGVRFLASQLITASRLVQLKLLFSCRSAWWNIAEEAVSRSRSSVAALGTGSHLELLRVAAPQAGEIVLIVGALVRIRRRVGIAARAAPAPACRSLRERKGAG